VKRRFHEIEDIEEMRLTWRQLIVPENEFQEGLRQEVKKRLDNRYGFRRRPLGSRLNAKLVSVEVLSL